MQFAQRLVQLTDGSVKTGQGCPPQPAGGAPPALQTFLDFHEVYLYLTWGVVMA